MTTFDVSSFILSMLAAGSPVLVLNGWVSAKWTHADGIWNQLQSWLIAILLVAGASLTGLIPIPITEFWAWLSAGFANGAIANLLYKSGVLDNILNKIGAGKTA